MAAWHIPTTSLASGRGLRGVVERGSSAASFDTVLRGLREDAGLRAEITRALAAAPFAGFKWETPAVCRQTLARMFEFVVLESAALVRPADPGAFREHFVQDASVVEFPSLGGDAILVAPCPRAASDAYGHLAAFARKAR